MKNIKIYIAVALWNITCLTGAYGQELFQADGPGNTYEYFRSKGMKLEIPDCGHAVKHVSEVFDSQLNKYVFAFDLHRDLDDDRCTNDDRQRNELTVTDSLPPSYLGAHDGETWTYSWKFKLDANFKSNPSFCHIHQIKAIGGGDDGAPMVTLTTRAGSPENMQLILSPGGTVKTANMSAFKGVWVEATETITYGNSGSLSIVLKRVSDGVTLLSYSSSNVDMGRSGAFFYRPKIGIYRSLNNTSSIRDERVLYADFCIARGSIVCSGTGGHEIAPTPPANIKATVLSNTSIRVSWYDNVYNDNLYRIEQSTDGTTWSTVTTVTPDWERRGKTQTNDYTITGLSPGTTYFYRIRTENLFGNAPYTNVVSATTTGSGGTVPAAPSGLIATAVSSSQINLSWTDNASNESLFRIERSIDAGTTWSSLTTVGANVTTYSNTGLTASTTYHYRVRAENTAGNSTFSNTANATTTGSGTLPSIGAGTTQAEVLNKSGFEENVFEGVTCVRALSTTLGFINGTFTGSAGSYTITIRTFDENDGAATFTLKVNGNTISSRTLSVNDNTWKDWVVNDVTLGTGDEIRIEGARESGEHARIDLFQIAIAGGGGEDIYLEAESGSITAPMQIQSASSASGGQYIAVASGNNSSGNAPSTGRSTYSFSITSAGTYKIWGRTIAPVDTDDSFWVRVDNGTWINWNNITPSSDWLWDDVHNGASGNTVVTFSLSAGSHTLDIAYREDGTQLDRLLITNDLSLNPNTSASAARLVDQENTSTAQRDAIFKETGMILYPNPSSKEVTVKYILKEEGIVVLSLYNASIDQFTVLVHEHKPAGIYNTTIDISKLPPGTHFVRLAHHGELVTNKLLKQ